MTPNELIAALKDKLGDGFTVHRNPKRRPEPQFDVFPSPKAFDAKGNPYRATFSVRSKDLSSFDDKLISTYAETIAANIAIQRVKGEAAIGMGE